MGIGELTDWDGYAARWSAMHGGLDPRHSLPLTRGWMRLAYRCGRPLARHPISADSLTAVGLLAAVGAPLVVLAGTPWAMLAAGLVVCSALAETLDSAVVAITGRLTPLGSMYDAVAARLGEVCWLAAFWLAGTPGWLAAAACATAWLHEYARSHALLAGAGPHGMVTMGERPMRIAVSVVGLTLAGAAAFLSADLAIGAATMATTVWLLLGLGGLIQLAEAVHENQPPVR